MRFTFGTDESESDDDLSADDTSRESQSSPSRPFVPDSLGGLFSRLALVFAVLTALSVVATALSLYEAAAEPFVDQPTLVNSVSTWAWLLSHTATMLSLAGYTVWSFWRQRRLEEQFTEAGRPEPGPLRRPIRALQIAGTDSSDLDEHQRRVQKTVLGFVLAGAVGIIPIRIILGLLFGV